MLLIVLCTLMLVLPSHAQSLTAQSAQPPLQPSAAGLPLPDRERDFIAIFAGVRTRASGIRSTKDARLAMQLRLTKFLGEDSDAKSWTGVVDDVGTTKGGERWIAVEIAPGVTISTWSDRSSDPEAVTLIQPYSTLFPIIDRIALGDPIMFSAFIFGAVLAPDDAMIEAPRLIARFDAIKAAQ